MPVDVPLFVFGVFITILVAIGIALALAEFQSAHTPRWPDEQE